MKKQILFHRFPWFVLPDAIVKDREFSLSELGLYAIVAYKASEGESITILSLATMANVDEATVRRTLKRFMDCGWIAQAGTAPADKGRPRIFFTLSEPEQDFPAPAPESISGTSTRKVAGKSPESRSADTNEQSKQELRTRSRESRPSNGVVKSPKVDNGVTQTPSGFVVKTDLLARWKKTYPAVNVEQQIAEAFEWMTAKRDRQKIRLRKFLVNWLGNEQDKGQRGPVNGHRERYNDARERLTSDVRRIIDAGRVLSP